MLRVQNQYVGSAMVSPTALEEHLLRGFLLVSDADSSP